MKDKSPIYNGLRLGMKHKDIAKLADSTISKVRRASSQRPVRVLFIGDTHCGSNTGLTPPPYQYKTIKKPTTTEHYKRNKWAKLQKESWEWYVQHISMLQPIDKCFVLGDLIDGDGFRSGGTELITTDRKVQTCMAIETLEEIKAGGYIFVFGTPYHTGVSEDFEVDISAHFKSKIGSHEWETINGVVFDLKHKQSNTKNPFTSLYNEILDNREWAIAEEQPKADVLVRAHTHRFCFARIEGCTAIALPALEAYGNKFGARQCSRKVQFGLVALDVWPDGFIQEYVYIAKLIAHKTQSN